MKKIIQGVIAASGIALMTFTAGLFTGCASTSGTSSASTSLPGINPILLRDVAETATVAAVTAKPQFRPALVEATNVLSSAIAGGTISPTNLVSTIQGFGFIPANFVTQPELALVIQDLSDLTGQFAAANNQSLSTDTNFVAGVQAIDNGIIMGLNLVP